ncbi:MAG: divalent-cation tolerance protein CutA [Candidatus Kapaibacterium sp.]|nr:divalent-cation tolerance protein CutA [Bacteroidota bacterium]
MENTENFRVVYVTTTSQEHAEQMAQTLVQERVAACCSIIPQVVSVYRWNNAIEQSNEVLLMIKTSVEHLVTLQNLVTQMHPYQVPEILAVPITHVSESYAAWLRSSLE